MSEKTRHSIDLLLKEKKILVLDGAMSTPLEQMGCDLNDELWTAKILSDSPQLIRRVHKEYLDAGADLCITCSYQASIPGLMKKGYTKEEALNLIASSVTLLNDVIEQSMVGKRANEPRPLCLASVGPYGAYLADGSEYRGQYDISDHALREFHKERMETLWEAGADLLLMETIPSFREAMILADLAEEMNAPYWISFSCRDDLHINEGQLIAECARKLSKDHPLCKVIGVNCTAPRYITGLIRQLTMATDLPVAVYPNSGEEYDPATKTWKGGCGNMTFREHAREWMDAGASIVGGCCRTVKEHICGVKMARESKYREETQG